MMNKQAISRRSLITLFGLLITVNACQSLENEHNKYPSTIGIFNETGSVTINPTTILDSLNRGEINVFAPIVATPSDNAILPPGSIQWSQSDYLKVANALSQYVWNATFENWLVYYLAFGNECQNNLGGFDFAEIIYYKTIGVGWQKMYTARYIQINPLAGIVSWGGETDFPISDGWAAIDLTEFTITADDALRIAEENGGKDARLRSGNECTILISIPNHNDDTNWNVGYYYGINFEIIVDPYSGKYEFPTPIP